MMSIKPETLEFLKKLKNNNNRDWFEKNRTKFEAAKTDFEDFIQELINQLAKVIPLIKGQLAKNSVFRIYRDVRFSKNKEPYKLNFGAYICEGGKKSDRPGYYIQIQPGNGSFSAGGCWMPDTAKLKAIRQEIQYHPDDDPMQKIYMSGTGAVPLSADWAEISKPENFRCPASVLGVVNAIRATGDGLVQTRGRRIKVGHVEQPVAGTANLFVLPADDQRSARLSAVRAWLAGETDDALWLSDVRESDVRPTSAGASHGGNSARISKPLFCAK